MTGYVYSLNPPNIVADIPINSDTQVLIVLSHISMNNKYITLKGRISHANAERLKTQTTPQEFTDIIGKNIPDSISGSVSKLDIVHHLKGNTSEILIELVCNPTITTRDKFNEVIDSAVLL